MGVTENLAEYGLLGVLLAIALFAVGYLYKSKESALRDLNTQLLLSKDKHSEELLDVLEKTLANNSATRELLKQLFEGGGRDLRESVGQTLTTHQKEMLSALKENGNEIKEKINEIKLNNDASKSN